MSVLSRPALRLFFTYAWWTDDFSGYLPLARHGVKHRAQIQGTAQRAATLTNQMLAYAGKGPLLVEPHPLSDEEVESRVKQGLVNESGAKESRSVASILRANIFTRFNAIITVLLVIVLAAVTLPLGITASKEYAELEWPIDIAIAVVWLSFFFNFVMTVANRKSSHIYVSNWFFSVKAGVITSLTLDDFTRYDGIYVLNPLDGAPGAKEIEVDAVADRGEVIAYSMAEHVEHAGVHSGDSTIVLPAQRVFIETIRRINRITNAIAARLGITGPFNIQYLAKERRIQVIELNLRASRSFPFASKVYRVNFVDLATRAIMGVPVTYVLTHDGIGVGEDGPTHQPVEHALSLRAIPDLVVLRPADANETAAAWRLLSSFSLHRLA